MIYHSNLSPKVDPTITVKKINQKMVRASDPYCDQLYDLGLGLIQSKLNLGILDLNLPVVVRSKLATPVKKKVDITCHPRMREVRI